MNRQRGIALITAMLTVVIVATVAAYLSMGQNLWLRQSENLFAVAQADTVTAGAFNLASLLIAQDTNAATDHHGEIWAEPLPPFPVGQGTVTAEVSDAQGRFNLNNLRVFAAEDGAIFTRLTDQLGLERALLGALIDWVDDGGEVRADGAESDYYLALPAPYRAANRNLESIDELRLIKGFSAEAVQALRPFVTVLPIQNAKININTAPAEVLAALFSTPLDLSAAKSLVTARDSNKSGGARAEPFTDCAQLAAKAPGNTLVQNRCDLKTAYFEIMVAARFGRLTRTSQGLLERPAASSSGATSAAKILWTRNFVVKDIQLEKKD